LKKRWTLEGDSSYITKEHAKKYCHGKRAKLKRQKFNQFQAEINILNCKQKLKARGFESVLRKLIKLE
jgi:hypothetical protein